MKNFESTDTFMELLKNGKYTRHEIIEEGNEIDFNKEFDKYKEFVSQPGHYDYIERRHIL